MKHVIGLGISVAAYLSLLWAFGGHTSHEFWLAYLITSVFNLVGYVEGCIRTERRLLL